MSDPIAISSGMKQALSDYLGTAYKLSNRLLAAERSAMFEIGTAIAQVPYIETTPRYESGPTLAEIAKTNKWLPESLPTLASFGFTTSKYPLYRHQAAALEAAWDSTGGPRNIVVASGTGSGKTECFYLPILADILRESKAWAPGKTIQQFRQIDKDFVPVRQSEVRQSGMRALILYPMNALVNDQLKRLRKLLSSVESVNWQRENLNNNQIYFGSYTSQTPTPGVHGDQQKHKDVRGHYSATCNTWNSLSDEDKNSGLYQNPYGSELLYRWDMQATPPDLLITNYSMLEYMLLRGVDEGIFTKTRDWLESNPNHIFTIVVDEAHSYSGTKGTEISYLLKRLLLRIGAKDNQVRFIATSASLGADDSAQEKARTFAARLFGADEATFTVIQGKRWTPTAKVQNTSTELIEALATIAEPNNCTSEHYRRLVSCLGGMFDDHKDVSANAYTALESSSLVGKLFDFTATGKARSLSDIAKSLFPRVDANLAMQATIGLLKAGTMARQGGSEDKDVPPLIPTRMHLYFRGIAGLWACTDPKCPVVDQEFSGSERPCGKLYFERRLWCSCGAKVLECRTCRTCGLLFLGGVDDGNQSVWPFADDLSATYSTAQDLSFYCAEPVREWIKQSRSTKTGLLVEHDSDGGRDCYVPRDAGFPKKCPRCYKSKTQSREVIEPLGTTGPQSLGVLVDASFALQEMRTSYSDTKGVENKYGKSKAQSSRVTDNGKRKVLVFSDGRQDAALLAANLEKQHSQVLFRQILLLVLKEANQPLPLDNIKRQILNKCIAYGINPTFTHIPTWFQDYSVNQQQAVSKANRVIVTYIARDIMDRQYGIEALGLGRWKLSAEPEKYEILAKLLPVQLHDSAMTARFIGEIIRILCGEKFLLSEHNNTHDWEPGILPQQFKLLHEQSSRTSPRWPDSTFSVGPRLGRYIKTVCSRLSIQTNDEIKQVLNEVWDWFIHFDYLICPNLAQNVGYGVGVQNLVLNQLSGIVWKCNTCNYISADPVAAVCQRCNGEMTEVSHDDRQEPVNYYKRQVELALECNNQSLPFGLNVLEHTAQIDITKLADRERKFQGKLKDSENPIDERVDVLSVTTTMEMGIDIGDLTSVGLHNTPPTVANYQQRAGRAGRRSDSVATVFTFARQDSHDQWFFEHVRDLVAGPVIPPAMESSNLVILERHIASEVLSDFFRESSQGDTSGLQTTWGVVDDHCNTFGKQFDSWFESPSAESLINVLKQRFGGVSHGLDIVRCVKGVGESVHKVLTQCKEATAPVLDLLVTEGVLPRYAFPVDVVSLWTKPPNRWSFGEEIQRGMSIALSEYAPGAELVIDKQVIRPVGIYEPFAKDDDPQRYFATKWYFECKSCRHVSVNDRGYGDGAGKQQCELCGESIQPRPAVIPSGFRTDWQANQEPYRGGGKVRAGATGSTRLIASSNAREGTSCYSDRLFLHNLTGNLYTVNQGEEGKGLFICGKCGRGLAKENDNHHSPAGRECFGTAEQVPSILMHEFRSNLLLSQIDLPGGYGFDPQLVRGRGAAQSLLQALMIAGAETLQISPRELGGEVRGVSIPETDNRTMECFIYDTLPNGAGYAADLKTQFGSVLHAAITLCKDCPADCDSACYKCLLGYGNRLYHPILDRHIACDLLTFVATGKWTDNKGSVSTALDHLKPFASSAEDILLEDDYLAANVVAGSHKRCVIPIHPLMGDCSNLINDAWARSGVQPIAVSSFDLARRPFWVWRKLCAGAKGFREWELTL
jgi:ATP-dependent helicase YprA (DUF1998 family)